MATEGHKRPPPTKKTAPEPFIGPVAVVNPQTAPEPDKPAFIDNPYPLVDRPTSPATPAPPTEEEQQPPSPGKSTNVSPYAMIGIGPDGEPLPEPPKMVNPYDPTGELGIATYPGNPAAAPLVPERSTYSAEDLPKTTVPKDLESLLLPSGVTADKPGSGGLNPPPPGVGALGQLMLEMTPPGTKFEGETTIGPDGVPTTDWNVVVPGQEPTYWGRTQQVPLADGSSVDINYGSNGTPLLAKGEGDPALRLRLADDNDAPRWAVLNSAGEYLFTIDSSGNTIGEGGSASTVDPSAGLAGLGIGVATGTTTLGAALAESAAAGAAAGAGAGAPTGPGAAVTATLGLVVAVGLTYYMWETGVLPGSPHGKPQDDGVKPVDPNSLPEIGQPQPWIPPRVDGDEGVQPPPLLEPGPSRPSPFDDPDTVPRRPSPFDDPDTVPSRPSPFDDPDTVPSRPSPFDDPDTVPRRPSPFDDPDTVPRRPSPFDDPDTVPRRLSPFDDPDTVPRRPSPFDDPDTVPRRPSMFDDPDTGPRRPSMFDDPDTGPSRPSPADDPDTEPSRPSPADDPDTVSTQNRFPSTKEGQNRVPEEGQYWLGNRLMWDKGNPAGMKPGFAKNPDTKTDLNLQAVLYKLLESGIDDIDEEHRPPIMVALAVLHGTRLYQQTFLGEIWRLGNGNGYKADLAKLTSSSLATRRDELDRLADLGAPEASLDDAINEWWRAKAVVDRAKELLGEAGAIAMLRTDGWTVKRRPRGSGTHDIVAVKNGEVMVIEAKGGDPGTPRPGKGATVSAGPGSDEILSQQMTDPYLWHKLKQDAKNDPEFKQWLVDHGVWTAIDSEDPSRVGYRLIKVETKPNGMIKTIVYGSEQIPTEHGIPAETVIGQTTGNGPGPRLRGVALPLSRANTFVGAGNFPVGVLGQAGSWLGGLIQAGLHDVAAIGQLAVPVPAVPALLPGFRPPRTPANESLTVNVVQHTPPPGQIVSDDERLRGMTYL
ncbi:hypothetical protein [Rhodococcus sp. BE178]|uniref:hypothetical protein n=1 Tax=Rhodococcus sp. BE178 TaxID=2817737 RepID=UPI003D24D700